MPKFDSRKAGASVGIQAGVLLGCVTMGLILMGLTLAFRVNPAEGGVVDERIVGTPVHFLLLVSTMPAWLAGALTSSLVFGSSFRDTPWYWYSFMFVYQAILYAFIGAFLCVLLEKRGSRNIRGHDEEE